MLILVLEGAILLNITGRMLITETTWVVGADKCKCKSCCTVHLVAFLFCRNSVCPPIQLPRSNNNSVQQSCEVLQTFFQTGVRLIQTGAGYSIAYCSNMDAPVGLNVDLRAGWKHTGRNNLLFVEKMVWMDERLWPKMKSECCEEAELWWGYADMKVGWLWELCR